LPSGTSAWAAFAIRRCGRRELARKLRAERCSCAGPARRAPTRRKTSDTTRSVPIHPLLLTDRCHHDPCPTRTPERAWIPRIAVRIWTGDVPASRTVPAQAWCDPVVLQPATTTAATPCPMKLVNDRRFRHEDRARMSAKTGNGNSMEYARVGRAYDPGRGPRRPFDVSMGHRRRASAAAGRQLDVERLRHKRPTSE